MSRRGAVTPNRSLARRRVCTSGLALVGLGLFRSAASAIAENRVAVDRPAPEVEVRTLAGRVIRTRDLRGKVTVAVFWATWSPAARADLHALEHLYQRERSRGLEIIALSIDDDPAEVRAFWKRAGYTFPAALRDETLYRAYGRVGTTPLYYIIDRTGIVRYRLGGQVGEEKLAELVSTLLAESRPRS